MDSKTIIILLLAGGAALGVYWYINKKKSALPESSVGPSLPIPSGPGGLQG